MTAPSQRSHVQPEKLLTTDWEGADIAARHPAELCYVSTVCVYVFVRTECEKFETQGSFKIKMVISWICQVLALLKTKHNTWPYLSQYAT